MNIATFPAVVNVVLIKNILQRALNCSVSNPDLLFLFARLAPTLSPAHKRGVVMRRGVC